MWTFVALFRRREAARTRSARRGLLAQPREGLSNGPTPAHRVGAQEVGLKLTVTKVSRESVNKRINLAYTTVPRPTDSVSSIGLIHSLRLELLRRVTIG